MKKIIVVKPDDFAEIGQEAYEYEEAVKMMNADDKQWWSNCVGLRAVYYVRFNKFRFASIDKSKCQVIDDAPQPDKPQYKIGDTFMLDGVEVTIVRVSSEPLPQPKQRIFNKYKWIADALKRGHTNAMIDSILPGYEKLHGNPAPAGVDFPDWCDEL